MSNPVSRINSPAAYPAGVSEPANLLETAIAATPDGPPATRAEVVSLARRLTAKYEGRSSNAAGRHPAGPVRQALDVMANVYRATTDVSLRASVLADAEQLLQGAKDVGFLPKTHAGFVDFARAANPQRAPSVEVVHPTPNATATPTPTPATSTPPGVEQADPGLLVARPWDSRLEPFGGRASVWTGARVRTGTGEPPADWKGLPKAPYTEVGAGVVVTAGTPFDPRSGEQTVRSLAPRYQVYVDRGTPNNRIRAAVSVQAATLDPNGRRAAELQLSGVHRWSDGATTRGAIQIGTPPPKPGAGPAVEVLLEHSQPVSGLPAPLRGRITLSQPGDPGVQTLGVAFGMPGPSRGTFPASGRPVVDLAATWQQAPGKSSTTLAATVGYAAPSTVATTTVSRRETQSGQTTTTLSFAAQQRLQGSVGDPNTSTAAGGIDPRGVPTGRFPAGAKEPITTLYADGAVTLERSAPVAAPGATLGPDRVRVGIVHNRPEGPIPTLYGEVYGDLTPYAGGQSPSHGRLGGEIGIRMRPVENQPVTLDAALRAGAPGPMDAHGGTAVRLGMTVELDKDTAVQGGVQFPLGQQQGDPELYLRFTRRL
jgi:hypothetical protein